MKNISCIPRVTSALVLLMLYFSSGYVAANTPATFVSTFNSIGLYWSPAEGSVSAQCKVQYRILGTSPWKEALPLWFDPRNSEYRGSIVNLVSGTQYEIKLSLSGTETTETIIANTWHENFPIKKTVYVNQNSINTPIETPYVIIEGGSEAEGYVLYTALPNTTATIDLQNIANPQYPTHANIVVDASYVIIRGLNLINSPQNAIVIKKNRQDIVIDNNDIRGWGSVDTSPEAIANNWGVFNAAIYANINTGDPFLNLKRVIIQRNKIHDPRTDTNAWDEFRYPCVPAEGQCHPKGPQAVSFFQSEGNHVIRYNEIYSTNGNYYNDAFGAGENSSDRGFPNKDSDIYGNYISHAWDDGIESEGANKNVRIWGNYITDTFVKIAIAGTSAGPMYIWRNVANTSRQFATTDDSDSFGRGQFIKAGTPSLYTDEELKVADFASGRTYIFHNITLQPFSSDTSKVSPLGVGNAIYSSGPYNGGTGYKLNEMVSRNNIFMVPRSNNLTLSSQSCSPTNNFDYDWHNGFLESRDGVANCYATQEPHGWKFYMPNYADLRNYDLNSDPGHWLDQGEMLPNFNDYSLNAPDFGASEFGTPAMEYGVTANLNPDTDIDGIPDAVDNCPLTQNNAQENLDNDRWGDACDGTNDSADLRLTITDSPDPVLQGQNITYQVTVYNDGPIAAAGVTLAGLAGCLPTLPTSLNSGQSASCSVDVTATSSGTQNQTVSVSGNEFDPNTANNTASANTAVLGSCTASGKLISGTVKRSNRTAVSGVSMTLIKTTAPQCGNRLLTDSKGFYQFTKLRNGTYTVTPAKTGCSGFTPTSRTVTISGSNRTGQNFTGTCP